MLRTAFADLLGTATLVARPAAVSFALGDPGGLVERAHAAGVKVIHQVHTVTQAREAAALDVDVVIAQGSEAGGQGMAAGVGALVLGAAGANVGTRFLASEEASADEGWKRRIGEIESEDAVRFTEWSEFFPPARADTTSCRAWSAPTSSTPGRAAAMTHASRRTPCASSSWRRSGPAARTSCAVHGSDSRADRRRQAGG